MGTIGWLILRRCLSLCIEGLEVETVRNLKPGHLKCEVGVMVMVTGLQCPALPHRCGGDVRG
jgi:hypothetical protein